jgi:hypothetical protein
MNMRLIMLSVLFLLFCALGALAGPLPDPQLTPGVANPAITEDTMARTICNKRWSTKLIRPAASYTNKLKKEQIVQYGYMDRDPRHYEEDHLISLEIGGHPRDARNLWPQPRAGQWSAAKKDALENRLHKLVCAGQLGLRTAQRAIATDWVSAYKEYVSGE